MITITAAVIAGLSGAIVFSIFTAMARSMGMTTMSIEKTLGSMFGEGTTADILGWTMHLVFGTVFALIYAVLFSAVGTTSGWLFGSIFGLGHGLITGGIVLPMMSTVHPAMHTGKIKAPGFFAVNAGPMTPMGLIVGHIIFGAVVGGVYFLLA